MATVIGLTAYALWIFVFKMLFLTLAVYLHVSSNPYAAGFDEIHEWVSSNELTLMAISSALFVIVIRTSTPSRSVTWGELIHRERLTRRFLPGFVNGALIAVIVASAFIWAGLYLFLGLNIQAEDAALVIIQVVVRTLSCITLAYCEAYLFNQRWLTRNNTWMLGLLALAYAGIKTLQFEMSWIQLMTLLMLQLLISFRKMVDGDFGRGAGFLAGIWVAFHPWMSLPILGNSTSGIWILRPSAMSGFPEEWSRIISGGIGGPLSSPILQVILLALMIKAMREYHLKSNGQFETTAVR